MSEGKHKIKHTEDDYSALGCAAIILALGISFAAVVVALAYAQKIMVLYPL